MTDWTKPTGSTGTMMVRDTGTKVQFWIEAGSATFDGDMGWAYYYNGVWSSWRDYNFVGGAYRFLGEITVTKSQVVGFRIEDTGTSGLGGPTTLTVNIDRAEPPPRPTLTIVVPDGPNSVDINLDSNGTGGATVLQWQVGWALASANYPTDFLTLNLSNGAGTVTGLAKGTQYRFWGRGRNSEGWGLFSPSKTATTWKEPPAPTTPVISAVTQSSVHVVFQNNGNGGTPVIEWQLAYGLNATAPENLIGSTGTSDLTNLIAGRRHYFRARGRNSVGWGPWSAISSAQLRAGAFVFDEDGKAYPAVPYVKVAGVWKVVQPYVKIAGLWKPTA